MPYELIVDGQVRDLGDKRYLLSPQDLAAVNEIPALIAAGVVSFKIEGRLKSPEYVAGVCQVYRKAIDAALAEREFTAGAADRYQLEMTFSRGLYSGWMHGVQHQELVSARFGKKRGAFSGRIENVGRDFVELTSQVPLNLGDGVVFDTGGDTDAEQGGRIFQIKGKRLFFQHRHIDFAKLKRGDRVWKTDDPALNKRLQQSFAGKIEPRRRIPIDLRVSGRAGEAMSVEVVGAPSVRSAIDLQTARTAPLTTEKLRDHLGRFGDSVYGLGELTNALEGDVILPIGELNRLRRELVFQLDAARKVPRPENAVTVASLLPSSQTPLREHATLRVLCRSMDQLGAALSAGIAEVDVDFEDIRRYADAVKLVRERGAAAIFLATPRIQKAGEAGFFRLIENAAPDGVLIRNLGAIEHFQKLPALRKVGDFSLNVANPLTAEFFKNHGLERVTISYDLNIEQIIDLLAAAPPEWFEITLHQHMPMFHMEHCVFAAFMSKGKDFTDCGRPCEKHRVHLRDRVGMEHPLRADVGCRNTLFNAVAQTGAGYFAQLKAAGARDFRVELLEESAEETGKVIAAYRELLSGGQNGAEMWRTLHAQSQLGVTRGTLEVR